MLWVPYGFIPFVSTSAELSTLYVLPWVEQDLAQTIPEEMWGCISAANIAFGNKLREKMPWKNLLPALRTFSGTLFQTT